MKTKKRARAAIKPRIEFPREGERLETDSYTARIHAPDAVMVHAAVDQGEWRECRPSVGYWWFDWTEDEAGEHELIACASFEDGRESVSETVHCVR